MNNIGHDPKVCDKNKDGDVTAKNQKRATQKEIMESEDEDGK